MKANDIKFQKEENCRLLEIPLLSWSILTLQHLRYSLHSGLPQAKRTYCKILWLSSQSSMSFIHWVHMSQELKNRLDFPWNISVVFSETYDWVTRLEMQNEAPDSWGIMNWEYLYLEKFSSSLFPFK